MSDKMYVSLHNHSEYSIIDGLCKIKDFAKAAKEMGMPALALTDHGTLSGSIKFYKACMDEGIKPILGMEAYMCDNSLDKSSRYNNHLLLLAKNDEGWKNLKRLSTISYEQERYYARPRLDFDLLDKYGEGLIVSSACIKGEIAEAFLKHPGSEGYNVAKMIASKYKERFKDDYYLELMFHAMDNQGVLQGGQSDFATKQRMVLENTLRLSQELGIPSVLTNDCLDENSIILCKDTAKKIKDIRVGDLVLTHMGRFRRVVATWSRDSNKKRLKITSPQNGAGSPNKLIVTEDHKFYVFDVESKEFSWVEAKNLNPESHRLFVPHIEVSATEDGSLHSSFKGLLEIDHLSDSDISDLHYLVGLFLGNGHASSAAGEVTFFVYNKNKKAYSIIERVLGKLGDIEANFVCSRFTSYTIFNEDLASLFRGMFYDGGEKVVPDALNRISKLNKSAVIHGLWDCTKPSIDVDNINLKFKSCLLDSVSFFYRTMLEQGVYSPLSLYSEEKEGSNGWICFTKREEYSWSLSGKDKEKALDFLRLYDPSTTIGCSEQRSAKEYADEGILVEFEIHEVRHSSPVWDMEVEEDHSFCTNFGVVHNCHYICKDDFQAQQIKKARQFGRDLATANSNEGRDGDFNEYYLKSPQEIYNTFGKLQFAIEETLAIAEKCNIDIPLGARAKARLPNFDLETQDDYEAFCKFRDAWKETIGHLDKNGQYLTFLSWKGLIQKGLHTDERYKDRLTYELAVVTKTEFSKYFIVVRDYIQWAWKNNIFVGPGRGCFSSDCEVGTKEGLKQISDVCKGDYVLCHDGEYHEVSHIHEYEVDEDMIEIIMDDDRRIFCTMDHEIRVIRDGEERWVPACFLTKEDEIVDFKHLLDRDEKGEMAKIKSISKKHYRGKVIDLTVPGPHSYNIEGLVVHNSGAGSLMLFCLGITNIDPILYDLDFERFLAAEKGFVLEERDFTD